MKILFKSLIIVIAMSLFGSSATGKYEKLFYDFSFNNLSGDEIKLSDYKNKVIVVVNVASQCGFTKQYEDMQKIWEKYQSAGLIVLGVPSNDFGNQEPGNSAEIKEFCSTNFGISFPMTEKVKVKGSEAHPFYLWAKENFGKGAIPKWNFHKIVIDKNGKVFDTFSSITNPSSKKFTKIIEDLIKS